MNYSLRRVCLWRWYLHTSPSPSSRRCRGGWVIPALSGESISITVCCSRAMDDLKIILLQKDGPPCLSSICISNLLYKLKTGMISMDSESHSCQVDLKMFDGFDHRQAFFLHHCVSGLPWEQLLGEVGYRVVAVFCRLLAQHCSDPKSNAYVNRRND